MAAPIVSSIVAQMLEANPALTPVEVRELLLKTARPLKDVPRARQGYGVVNAAGAVAEALRVAGGAMEGLPLSPHVSAERVSFYYHDACPQKSWATRTKGVRVGDAIDREPGVRDQAAVRSQDHARVIDQGKAGQGERGPRLVHAVHPIVVAQYGNGPDPGAQLRQLGRRGRDVDRGSQDVITRQTHQVRLEGEVLRMRSKMGSLRGRALVDGKVVCEGEMTFAFGERLTAG